jgi:hypothetical protein
MKVHSSSYASALCGAAFVLCVSPENWLAQGFQLSTTHGPSKFGVPWKRSHSSLSTNYVLSMVAESVTNDAQSTPVVNMDGLQSKKTQIIAACQNPTKPTKEAINGLCRSLETMAEQLGVGQGSSYSGMMGGEWELLYSPEDVTRSSPFFWAFRKAFPDQSNDIFSITDAIPAPIKEVGPATQTIELTGGSGTSGDIGKFVSRVKVATLGGIATSIMTTRATIVGVEGLEGLRLKIETTKPEDSTVLKSLGPLGEAINSNSPPFPSGEALEQVRAGSSEVVMVTTFCDETLRVSRNSENRQDAYVWRRNSFASSSKV